MNDAPLILSLETATLGGSVWLGRAKRQLAARNGDPQVSQSNSLLSDINLCLEAADLALEDVDLFACASGPGSFTGLRIGIATLKGLAASLKRSCVGIPTLHAVAHSAGPSMATVAVLPAGRGEVFTQLFSVSAVMADHIVAPIDTAAHLSPQELIERYGMFPTLRWAGNGAHLQREIIESAALERDIVFRNLPAGALLENGTREWSLAATQLNLAKDVAALADQAHRGGVMQTPDELHAIYVRPSDAELNK